MKKLVSAAPGRVAILVGLLAAGLMFVACHGLGGSPGPKLGGGSIQFPTTATDWYIASTGSDSNGCNAASPCKTITGGIVSKLGTNKPTYGTAAAPIVVTIHATDTQVAGAELEGISANLFGPSTTLAIVGTPTPFATYTPINDAGTGAVTAKVYDGGTRLSISNMPDGSAAGMLVQKTAQGDGGTYTVSYAMIQSMDASTATMDQPLTGSPLTTVSVNPTPVEDDTWATGDSFQISTLPILNLEPIDVTAGDTDGKNGGLFLSMLEIPDQNGEAGKSSWRVRSTGGLNATLVKFDPNVIVDMTGSSATGNILGSQFLGGVSLAGTSTVAGGSASTMVTLTGPTTTLQSGFSANGGVNVADGTLTLGDVYCGSTMKVLGGQAVLLATGQLWGNSCTVNLVQPNTAFYQQADASVLWANLLLGGKDAGSIYKFDGGMQDNVGLTPAAVDTNTAIFNPNTGSRFTK